MSYVIDVDAAKVGVVLTGQHVDAEAGRRVAVPVDGTGRRPLAVASRPVANVHHTCIVSMNKWTNLTKLLLQTGSAH